MTLFSTLASMRSSASFLSLEADRLTYCEDEQRKGTRTLTAQQKTRHSDPIEACFIVRFWSILQVHHFSLAAVSQAWELEPGPFSVKKGRFFEEELLSFSSKNAITVFL